MYTMEARIRLSETDRTGRLSMNGLLRLFQDCGYSHAQDRNLGLEYTQKTHCTWYLLSWQIFALRMPMVGETVRIETCIYDRRASLAHKSIAMYNAAGERLAAGDTMWVYMDVLDQQPAEPSKEAWLPEDFGERLDLPPMPRRIIVPQDCRVMEPCRVQPYLLDTNGHANNVRLTELAMRLCGADAGCTRLRAEFRKQVRADGIICPAVKERTAMQKGEEAASTVVVFRSEEGEMGEILSVFEFGV